MGVTYKLKDEIVDFIIRQKRENPRISCRKLVIVIEENFQVHVSKSSVNGVIKDAQLSSPVGRSSSDSDKIKKFSIPREKKVQLFGVSPIDSAPTIDTKSVEDNKPKSASVSNQPNPILEEGSLLDKNDNLIHEMQSLSIENKKENKIDIDESVPDVRPEDELQILDATISTEKKDVHGSIEDLSGERRFENVKMELFLTRMAFRDFFQRPAFEEFFKKHTALSEREIQIIDVLLCFLPMVLECPSLALDQKNLWLWFLNGWEEPPQIDEIEQIINYLNGTKISRFDYFLEIGYFCSMVTSVKFILENQKELILDGRLRLLSKETTTFFPPCPIERSAEEVTRFISGDASLTLFLPFPEALTDIIGELISFCESMDNKLKKIILMGAEEKQMLTFGHVPHRPRNFILSVVMPPDQFEGMFNASLEFSRERKIIRAGKELMYVDSVTQLSIVISGVSNSIPIRTIAFYEVDTGLAEIFITNIPFKTMATQDFETHPLKATQTIGIKEFNDEILIQIEADLGALDSEITLAESLKKTGDLIKRYIEALYSKILKNEELFPNICNQKGYIILNRSGVKIDFKLEGEKDALEVKTALNVIRYYNSTTCNCKKLHIYIK